MSKASFGEFPLWFRQMKEYFAPYSKDFALVYSRAWGHTEVWHGRNRIALWCGTREAIFREGEFFSLDLPGLVTYIYQRIGQNQPVVDRSKKKGRSRRIKPAMTPLEVAMQRMGW